MRGRVLESAGVAAGIGLAVAWVRLSGSSWLLYRGGLVVCGVATAVVIAAAVHPDRGQVHRVLSWKPLRGLGLVSYGVYLWHWPLFVVLDSSRVHLGGWPLFSVRVATTLAVSIASYRWIEQPIRRGAFRPRVALAAGAAVASVLVGAIVVATAGTLPAQTITLPPTSGGVLVVGNSLGINLGFALDRAGLGVSIHSTVGCSLVPGKFNIRGGTPARSCGPFGEWVKAQRPQFVLLMELGAPGDATTVTVDGNTTAVTSSRYREMYKTDLQDAIDKLSATGATIIVPNVPCWGDNAEVPSSQRPQFNARLVEENELLHEVVTQPENRARVVSPDLRKFVCPLDRFQRSLGNVADARPDGAHFSPQGADVVARWLLQQVPSLSAAKRTPHSLADDLFDRLNAERSIARSDRAGRRLTSRSCRSQPAPTWEHRRTPRDSARCVSIADHDNLPHTHASTEPSPARPPTRARPADASHTCFVLTGSSPEPRRPTPRERSQRR